MVCVCLCVRARSSCLLLTFVPPFVAGEIHPFPPITPPCPVTPCPPCPTIAPLPDFSAFAIADINSKNADDLGHMAAGGDITLDAYSIGMGMPINGSCPYALVAGGKISYTSGEVIGNIAAGGAASVSDVAVPNGCAITQNVGRNSIVDFDVAAANMKVRWCAVGLCGSPALPLCVCVCAERVHGVLPAPCHEPHAAHVRPGDAGDGLLR